MSLTTRKIAAAWIQGMPAGHYVVAVTGDGEPVEQHGPYDRAITAQTTARRLRAAYGTAHVIYTDPTRPLR